MLRAAVLAAEAAKSRELPLNTGNIGRPARGIFKSRLLDCDLILARLYRSSFYVGLPGFPSFGVYRGPLKASQTHGTKFFLYYHLGRMPFSLFSFTRASSSTLDRLTVLLSFSPSVVFSGGGIVPPLVWLM